MPVRKLQNSNAPLAGAVLLTALLASAPAQAEVFWMEATCASATTCTMPFHVSGTSVSFPRQLSCHWTQNDPAQPVRRVLAVHQPNGMPAGATIAVPMEREAATAMAFNVTLQPARLFNIKGGKLNVQFEWAVPVTSTIKCSYIFSK